MALFLNKFPFNDTIVIPPKEEHAGKATDELIKWAESIERQVDASPVLPEPVVQIPNATQPGDQSNAGNLGVSSAAGLYRVSVYREITTADPVSSSLNGSISWTHNGKALSRNLSTFAGAPQTVNDSAGDTLIVEIDPNTDISYSLNYVSNTPGLMEYCASLSAELISTLE